MSHATSYGLAAAGSNCRPIGETRSGLMILMDVHSPDISGSKFHMLRSQLYNLQRACIRKKPSRYSHFGLNCVVEVRHEDFAGQFEVDTSGQGPWCSFAKEPLLLALSPYHLSFPGVDEVSDGLGFPFHGHGSVHILILCFNSFPLVAGWTHCPSFNSALLQINFNNFNFRIPVECFWIFPYFRIR